MATPTLDRFLQETYSILQQKAGPKLQQYLIIEPPYPDIYNGMIQELKRVYSTGSPEGLEAKLESLLPDYEDEDSPGAWPAFRMFLRGWLAFISNVNVSDILKTHGEVVDMVRQSQLALGDSAMGIVMLPTVISYAQTLAKFTNFLEKQPELLQQAQNQLGGGDDEDSQENLAASTARVIIEALKKCVHERQSAANNGLDRHGKPDGRRAGIYILANICLKLLTRAGQFRVAETIFTQIILRSPPLSRYPASQRVTYLYYLGRYHFSNNHFLRAAEALQGAYSQSRPQDVNQRRNMLVYLITSNIILGRLPNSQLLQRQEARQLASHFLPLTRAIRTGNLLLFRELTDIDAAHVRGSTPHFFLSRGVLLQIQHRVEVIVNRTLTRKVFRYAGSAANPTTKSAPNMDIGVLRAVVVALEARANEAAMAAHPDTHFDINTYVDPDFDGCEQEDVEYLPYAISDEDINDDGSAPPEHLVGCPAYERPTLPEVEGMLASLLRQGLMVGFLSHKQMKYVVSGSKDKDPVSAGFPQVWSVMKPKRGDVVGWVTDEMRGQPKKGGKMRVRAISPTGVSA